MSSPVSVLVREATARLEAAGVPSPEHDAWALLEHATGLRRGRPTGNPGRGDGWPRQVEAFETCVRRRAAREPLQHITGRAYFRHLTLAVGPGVFVPRPETELVAGAAIAAARAVSSHHPPVVVDLGTGSGAIALAVAEEVPAARVLAVEADPAAHAWAERNSAGTRVELRLGDMGDAFPDLDGTVDVVVSNPPYIPVGAHIRDAEVSAHDPALALWSGEDGLDAMRVVQQVAARLLRDAGTVVAEHADLQGSSAPEIFRVAGWTDVSDHRDLTGRDRYVTARRTPRRDRAAAQPLPEEGNR